MRTIPEAELLAYLRQPGFTDEDLLNRLHAMGASYSCVPALVDAIDGAIAEIEGYQDRQRDLAREEAESERPMRTRLTWAQRLDEEQGIPSCFTREAAL